MLAMRRCHLGALRVLQCPHALYGLSQDSVRKLCVQPADTTKASKDTALRELSIWDWYEYAWTSFWVNYFARGQETRREG